MQLASNIDYQQCRQKEPHSNLGDLLGRGRADELELRGNHAHGNGEQHSDGRLQGAQKGDKQFLGSLTHHVRRKRAWQDERERERPGCVLKRETNAE